ncbi:hypothetical protein M8C13_21435 [Crossiella sp. SN42]|uniref:hypothetical protein n=1 Tax=Crossiella sp. SN42 TaxID=2944808 RepID=UPI00207C1E6F|nr:hypothetical protein [Crossiella sp. SN42]MCO1578320.1 hypothetical protein [Crossiella sp. SN42]
MTTPQRAHRRLVQRTYGTLADPADAARTWADLAGLVRGAGSFDPSCTTFVAAFDAEVPAGGEAAYRHLLLMAEEDERRHASEDPAPPRRTGVDFVITVAGQRFFVSLLLLAAPALSFTPCAQFNRGTAIPAPRCAETPVLWD